LAFLIAVFFAATSNADASEYKAGTLEVKNPWARATPKGATVSGAYLTIKNTGASSDRLIGGSSAIADHLEIHQMAMDRGVMQMRQLKNGLEIKPGETIEFKPGSYHIMLMGLKGPLEQGKEIAGTLTFEKAGTLQIIYGIAPVGAPSHSHNDHTKH
jgi:hypothetical protein